MKKPELKSIDPTKYEIFEKINGEAHGNFSSVTVYEGKLYGGTSKRVFRLIQRRPLDKNDSSIPTDTQLRLRDKLKGLKVPVIPMYRHDK